MSLNLLAKSPRYHNCVHRLVGAINTSSACTSCPSSIFSRIGFSNQGNLRYKSQTTTAPEFEDLDKPIKFTTSKASQWDTRRTFGNDPYGETPEIQAYSIYGSLFAFLIYFCILREENQVDEEMKKTLWERIPGLEKSQLKVVYNYNREHGLDNAAILARIKELEEIDAKKNAEKLFPDKNQAN